MTTPTVLTLALNEATSAKLDKIRGSRSPEDRALSLLSGAIASAFKVKFSPERTKARAQKLREKAARAQALADALDGTVSPAPSPTLPSVEAVEEVEAVEGGELVEAAEHLPEEPAPVAKKKAKK